MRSSTSTWWAQAVQNRLIALVLAMVVLVPLAATPADRSVQGLAAMTFEGLAILLLAMLLWRAKVDLRRESILGFLRTGANLPALLLLAVAGFSCLWSPQPAFSIQEGLRLGAGVLLYFVVAYQFRRSEHLSKLVDTLLFLGIAAAAVGFAQYGMSSEEYASGLFGNKQLYGSFLMLLLPVVALVAITERTANRQLAAQVATVLMASALLLAHARSSWLGLAAGLAALGVLALAFRARNTKVMARKHEVVLPVMLMAAAAALFLILTPRSESILNRAATLSSGKVASEDSLIDRATWARGAMAMVAERPLLGHGAGMYAYMQEKYTRQGIPLYAIPTRASLGEQAHNFWLQTAAELGLVGAGAMALVLVLFWVGGVRRLSGMDAGLRRTLLMGSLAASVAFAVDGLASPSWQFGQVSMFLWLVIGMGVGSMRSSTRSREESAPVLLPLRFARPAAVMGALALAALLPTAVLAGDGGCYKVPESAEITPARSSIRGGQIQCYKLYVNFRDCEGNLTREDVTLVSPNTKFSQVGGLGGMAGPNKSCYQSRYRENRTVFVTGTYTQGSTTVSATATLTVHYP